MAKGAYLGISDKAKKINKIYFGLPKTYTPIEYLQSTGTQYIDTGFKHNQDTRVVMRVQATSISENAWAFEGRNSTSEGRQGVFFYYSSDKKWKADFDGSGVRVTYDEIASTDELNIDFNKNVCTINGISQTLTNNSFQSNYNLTLLATNTAGTVYGFLKAKLYSCQIYDNGTLIRDYVPCVDSDGVACMYDLVEQKPYYNAGTGTFTAGAQKENTESYNAGLAKKVKKAYIGDENNIARLFYSLMEKYSVINNGVNLFTDGNGNFNNFKLMKMAENKFLLLIYERSTFGFEDNDYYELLGIVGQVNEDNTITFGELTNIYQNFYDDESGFGAIQVADNYCMTFYNYNRDDLYCKLIKINGLAIENVYSGHTKLDNYSMGKYIYGCKLSDFKIAALGAIISSQTSETGYIINIDPNTTDISKGISYVKTANFTSDRYQVYGTNNPLALKINNSQIFTLYSPDSYNISCGLLAVDSSNNLSEITKINITTGLEEYTRVYYSCDYITNDKILVVYSVCTYYTSSGGAKFTTYGTIVSINNNTITNTTPVLLLKETKGLSCTNNLMVTPDKKIAIMPVSDTVNGDHYYVIKISEDYNSIELDKEKKYITSLGNDATNYAESSLQFCKVNNDKVISFFNNSPTGTATKLNYSFIE